MTRFALSSGQSFVIAVTKLFEVPACVPTILLSFPGSQRQLVSSMTLSPAVGGYEFFYDSKHAAGWLSESHMPRGTFALSNACNTLSLKARSKA